MLKNLYIKNYALIESIEVDFTQGLNIITGETGAGKSIIIDALSLILGERADTETVRKGAEKAIVEGTFDISNNKKVFQLLKDSEIETQNELILRREVSIKGTSRCFVNDSPVSLTLIKNIGDLLVDLHGQHEHQSLLRPETHIDLLDDFAGINKSVQEFKELYEQLICEIENLEIFEKKELQIREKKELYELQLKEINDVSPVTGEDTQIEMELKILENAEKLNELAKNFYEFIYNSDECAVTLIGKSKKILEQLIKIDPSLENTLNELETANNLIKEVAFTIRNYIDSIEFNPQKLEQCRNRLGQINYLKKKYGTSIEKVLEYREKILEELNLLENFDSELNKISSHIEKIRTNLSQLAEYISIKRKDTARIIDAQIIKVLSNLGINNSRFETRIYNNNVKVFDNKATIVRINKDYFETNSRGIDTVEFYISTNLGEDLKPLAKVASGGEISRIMLAIKTILAKSEKLPLLIFDEIDIGISGKIAQVVGMSLKNLSKYHQIIAITHLPQIAALADSHYLVEKVETKERATTYIRKLQDKERIYQIAKLLSGTEVTDAALQSAKELMNYKFIER